MKLNYGRAFDVHLAVHFAFCEVPVFVQSPMDISLCLNAPTTYAPILQVMSSPFHVHLIAPSNEDSTYIKPLWAATLAAHTPDDVALTFRDDGPDPIDLALEGNLPALGAVPSFC